MKPTIAACILAVVSASDAHAGNTDMISSCTQIVQDYAWYLDHPGEKSADAARKFADLFTEDAVLTLTNSKFVDETFVGHDAIMGRYLRNRDSTRFLHIMSNIRIVPTGEGTARGTNYVTVYMHPIGGSMAEKSIKAIAEYRDEYRMTDEGCRISSRLAHGRLLGETGAIEDPKP